MSALSQQDLSAVGSGRAILTPATRAPQEGDNMLALLAKIASAEFGIPAYDYEVRTYFGSTNNVQTKVYKVGGASGTTVATLTYTYVASGVADNDRVATITKS